MNTAIIGLGNIGSQLAKNLTTGGENVIVADRTLAKAEKLAAELGGKARPMPVAYLCRIAHVFFVGPIFGCLASGGAQAGGHDPARQSALERRQMGSDDQRTK